MKKSQLKRQEKKPFRSPLAMSQLQAIAKDQPNVKVTNKASKKPDPKKKPTSIPKTSQKDMRIMHRQHMIQRRLKYNQHTPVQGPYLQHFGNLSARHPLKHLPIPMCYNEPQEQETLNV